MNKTGKRVCAIGLGMAAMVLACGCKQVGAWTKEKVNEKMEEKMVGKPVEVTSISTDCYVYQQLSHEEQVVYDQILHCMLEQEERVVVSTKDAKALQKVYDSVLADYGGLFWVSGFLYRTYRYREEVIGMEFIPKYDYTREERDELQAQVDAVVEEWLSGIGPNDSDYAKTKYVFETLIQNVEYNKESENNQNILSVFLGKETVCQGYANATQYLLQQLDIPCTIIRGEANGESHAWNLVCIDGEYYLTDTTWGNGRYRMPDESVQKQIDYTYLNATTEEFAGTHVPNVTFFIPECNSRIQ